MRTNNNMNKHKDIKSKDLKEKTSLFMKKLKEMPDFNKVKFVFLFGSYAQGRQNKLSDVDFAVYHSGNESERFKFRIKFGAKLPDTFDIQIFRDLPLYVRMEVLKGKLIFAKDLDLAYSVAYETIKAFDDFKGYLQDYIERRKLKL